MTTAASTAAEATAALLLKEGRPHGAAALLHAAAACVVPQRCGMQEQQQRRRAAAVAVAAAAAAAAAALLPLTLPPRSTRWTNGPPLLPIIFLPNIAFRPCKLGTLIATAPPEEAERNLQIAAGDEAAAWDENERSRLLLGEDRACSNVWLLFSILWFVCGKHGERVLRE